MMRYTYDLNENGCLMEFLYKNGNPHYTVIDFDHGTRRMWGNTKYHGIAELRLLA